MCGICGIINLSGQSVSERHLQSMMQAMKHRGPDDEGIFSEENVIFGFVRLSIIDLSADGHQPMLSSDGRYVMVFNGEIYNYIELRKELEDTGIIFKTRTDSEVLLNAYIHWGDKCLHRFNGMWAFIIYDRIEKKIFASRDRYGVKPFYYTIDQNRLIFGSEIPVILAALGRKPAPNYQAIFDFLVFNRTDQTEDTFFAGIKKLQHGSKLSIENLSLSAAEVTISKWYILPQNLKSPFQSPEEYRSLFSSAVGLRLRSDVPVGVCLSGGLDSSSIVSTLMKDHDKKDLNTFSAVYRKDQFGDESKFIHEYDSRLHNMFFTTPDATTLYNDLNYFVKAHAEPIPSTSPYAQYKVMELAQKKVVVTLDGQGADEQLAGYHYFFGLFFKDLMLNFHLGLLGKEMLAYVKTHHSAFGLKSFAYFLLPEKLRTQSRVSEKGYLNREFVKQYKNQNTIAGNLYASQSLQEALLDHFEYKLEHLLKWEDRNSMFFSLEARTPFLDYRLVERTLSLQGTDVIKNGITKHILREAMKGILPETIRLRQDKIGFGTPQDEWFREPVFQNLILSLLNTESFRSRNLIDHTKALHFYQLHLSGKGNYAKEIWKWIHLELWFRQFID